MQVDRPSPGEELNEDLEAAPTEPRQAATVIVLRGGVDALEVLLVQRNPAQRFMGGAWVFPGGAVDAHEGGHTSAELAELTGRRDEAHRLAAVREAEEEADIVLPDPGALVKFSRWITPAVVKIRFDTHFFLAPLPAGAEPKVDGDECVAFGWFTPRGALDAHAREEIALVFPTIKHLEQLEPFSSADALLDWATGRDVQPVVPQIVLEGEVARVLLPGEPGFIE